MTFEGIIKTVNDYLWGYILIFLLVGTGIYFSIKLRFPQIRQINRGMKQVFGGIFKKGEKADKDGMTSFQALATAIAAQVGTGNLAGVATAIASGGPGAIFWMWISAFFGMSTIFAEAVLAQIYKEKIDGEITGGPAYYISKGAKSKGLAVFFSIAIIIALGFVGNMVQSNSIAAAANRAFGINKIWIGIFTAIVAGMILIGGITRIASFTELVVPFMAVLYIVGSLIIIIINYRQIIPAFRSIFVGAFSPQAIAGGVLGVTIKEAIRYGVSRGLFSNEAGMGSTPHAHAVAKVNHPGEQGLVAMVGVFIDTVVICTMTALVIITTGVYTSGATGPELTQMAFTAGFGKYGNPFIAISLFFFAFSTIIGWYFFGEANIRFLFGKGGIKYYRIIVLLFVVFGSILEVELVWSIADMFNGLMIIPNLIALFILSSKVSESLKDFESKI
ncbi:alanine/glycine:cation symporter family protein [Sporanaerobacter acetigenes]|uniref:Alanine or glycine:cation symporter, AGCS family n=1 Tax=Sporanaerobacter acetigenes DSM 13106 TaxID=1123281 RepID=A0A1M5YTR7_9FIRM|nr:sodium:alanine symporter family protein [Sporanaerobacter acetigenes]SHI15240.1 alanine or glycine:cation symporter, AGCS family [Sporanaerobacter acetigenes DSM 13106]